MRKFLFILTACFHLSVTLAQSEDPPPIKTEQQLENLAEATETETEDDSYLQSLAQFKKSKLNLNIADASELKELILLSDLQIQSLIKYRQLLGKLVSIYELQSIPSWDVETIQKLLPFIKVDDEIPISIELKKRFNQGQHTVLGRIQQVIEKSEGFIRPDSVASRYTGSPQRLFLRYKYVYRNLLQYGLVAEKDAGEQFFKGSSKGFDFYSYHFFARKLGPIKALALGDFTINLGQGLIHWQSLAFKKSADIIAIKRQSDVLRPYNSAGEYNFQRGVGVTVAKNRFEVTAFASYRKLDANFHKDTSLSNDDFISSVLTSGYHRTPSEINDKYKVHQTSFGGNISYNANSFHVGFNGVVFAFSEPLVKNLQPYNHYAIQGKSWHNYSLDYNYTWRNLHLFGEAALDKNYAKAFLNGLLVSLHPQVDASLVYRNIQSSYQTLYGNAFTENTYPTNETGLFTGISIKPVPFLRVDAYADVFSFPWLRYRVDAPTKGSEYMVQLTYKPNREVEIYTRYRNENKAINISVLSLPTHPVMVRPRQNWRIQSSYKISRELTLKNRTEIVWYDHRNKDLAQQGFLIYADVGYKPMGKPYAINGRLQYFETDGFDSRLYAYENDVLYSFSIPFFYDKGARYYLNLNYDISKKATCWFRFAQTLYDGKNVIGSGLDEIAGNKKTEIKLQVMYTF